MAVVIPLVTEFDQKGIRIAEKRFNDFKNETSKIGQSIKAAFMPAAAAVAGLGAAAFGAAKAAMEDQQSAAMLARQLQATTKATNAQVKATEAFVASLSMSSGVADDELRPALARILRSTKDVTKAQKLLKVSLDVAKGSGKSLQQVTEAISRAYGGNVKALARLDPSLKSFITKTTTADEAVALLAKNFEGAAARNAETFAGRMDILKVQMAETYEQIGYALLPILERLINYITTNVVPIIQRFADALTEKGLKGAIKDAATSFGNFIQNADGWQGIIVSLTGTVLALGAAIKALMIFNAVNGAASALAGTLSALGTAILPGVAVSAGAVAGIFASLFATVFAFVDLMRDAPARSAFLEYVANTAKLIANIFIFISNTISTMINAVPKLLNLIPGLNVSEIPLMDYYNFTFDTAPGGSQNRGKPLSDSAQIQINVNGAIDPVSTGRQIADILSRVDRRGIGIAP